jgi:TonB family protein
MKLRTPAKALILLIAMTGAVRSAPTVQPPEILVQTKPVYSESMLSAGVSGKVTVQFSVDATGAVQNVTVFKSDHPELEAPAVEAVRGWKFKPATKDGQPVAIAVMRVPIDFSIPPTPFRAGGTFGDALKQAEQEHKIVFVDFFTTWCEPCKMLDRGTWQDPAVIALLRDKAVALRIDAEKNVELAGRYHVNAYPTLALIRPDGTLIDSLVGYRDAPTFCGEFTDALAGKTKFAQAREAVEKAGADLEKQAKARYDLGKELARKGENAAALAEYLWCFDVGMNAPSSSYSGVRTSYLLGDIAGLGSHYPPALDALRTRRDAALKLLPGDRGADREFGAINHYLGDDSATLAAFDKFPDDKAFRMALGFWLFDKLVEAKRYRDAASAVPAENYRNTFAMLRTYSSRNESMRVYAVESAAKEIEALAGAGLLDDARGLVKTVLEFDPADASASAVRSHLQRAGHEELMPSQPPGAKAASAAPPAAPAAAPTQESIEKLLEVTNAEKLLSTVQKQIDAMSKSGLNQALGGQALSPETQQFVDGLQKKISAEMSEELSWDKMKDLYIQVYSESFTQEEIDGLIAFYESPAGKAFVAKMPVVMQKTITLTQQRMGPIMQKLQRSIKEAVLEVEAAKKKAAASAPAPVAAAPAAVTPAAGQPPRQP